MLTEYFQWNVYLHSITLLSNRSTAYWCLSSDKCTNRHRVVRGSNLFNPTQLNPPNNQPNPYQSENLDQGPNPTHNPTNPIKTTTNLLVQERQLSNRSREEIRDAPNYKFTKQFDANICEICLLTPWPSVSTTLVASMNSAHKRFLIFVFLTIRTHDPTQPTKNQQISTQPNPTQPNPWVDPTHGQLWTDISTYNG